MVGFMILKALLSQFSFLNRNSEIGMSWEFHMRCKKAFEVKQNQTWRKITI